METLTLQQAIQKNTNTLQAAFDKLIHRIEPNPSIALVRYNEALAYKKDPTKGYIALSQLVSFTTETFSQAAHDCIVSYEVYQERIASVSIIPLLISALNFSLNFEQLEKCTLYITQLIDGSEKAIINSVLVPLASVEYVQSIFNLKNLPLSSIYPLRK